MDYRIKKANDLSVSLSNGNKETTNDLLKMDPQGYKTILDMRQKEFDLKESVKAKKKDKKIEKWNDLSNDDVEIVELTDEKGNPFNTNASNDESKTIPSGTSSKVIADSERWKIIQDMQTKNFKTQDDMTVKKEKNKMFDNWDDYINSDTKSDNTTN